LETFSLKNDGVIRVRGVHASSVAPRNRKLSTCSASRDGNASVETDAPFPADYSELLEQVGISWFSICISFLFVATLNFDIDEPMFW